MKKPLNVLACILAAALLTGGCAAPAQEENAQGQAGVESTAAVPEEGQGPGGLTRVEASLEPVVLADNDSLTATVTEYNQESDRGPAFTLLLENKTESTLYFTMENVSVNDVMNDPFWGVNVAAGDKISSELYWAYQDLATTGIHYIQEVEGVLWVYDADDYSVGDVYKAPVAWHVDNGETELPPAEEAVFRGGIEEIELLATEELTAVIKDYSPQGEWGPMLTIYLENNTDSTILFRMSDVTVNGKSFTTHWTTDVQAGKVAYSPCYWWQDDLEENQIREIETMSFAFHALDFDTMESLTGTTVTISLEGDGAVLARSGDDAQP